MQSTDSTSPTRFPAACRLRQPVGIGLRAPHYRELLALPAAGAPVGWLEVHSENYFGAGGQPLYFLDRFRERYPISLHGVGLSLGSADPLSREHLGSLRRLIDRVQPMLVSEHLSWGRIDGRYLNDLLPMPYTDEALAHCSARVAEAQDRLGRRLLIENVSSYFEFACSTIPEWEFLAALAASTGCGLLLDINNIHVSAHNHGFDSSRYLQAIPRGAVGEMHLAGYEQANGLLVDTHSRPVSEPVWQLYREAAARFGPVPTLIEWDADIPPLADLIGEARKVSHILETLDERLAVPAA